MVLSAAFVGVIKVVRRCDWLLGCWWKTDGIEEAPWWTECGPPHPHPQHPPPVPPALPLAEAREVVFVAPDVP